MKYKFCYLLVLLISFQSAGEERLTEISLGDTRLSIKYHKLEKIVSVNIRGEEYIFPGSILPSDKLSGFSLSNFNEYEVKELVVSFQLHNDDYWEHYEWAPVEFSATYSREMKKSGSFTTGFLSNDQDGVSYEEDFKSLARTLIDFQVTPPYILSNDNKKFGEFMYEHTMPWFKKEIYRSDNEILSLAINKDKSDEIFSFEYNKESKNIDIVNIYSKIVLHAFNGDKYKYIDSLPDSFFYEDGSIYFSEDCVKGSPFKAFNLETNKIEWTMMVSKKGCYVNNTNSFQSKSGDKEILISFSNSNGAKLSLITHDTPESKTKTLIEIKSGDIVDEKGSDSYLFNEVDWDGSENKIYFDNTGGVACIWQYTLNDNTLIKIVPEHMARFPRWFKKGSSDWVSFVIGDRVFIASENISYEGVTFY